MRPTSHASLFKRPPLLLFFFVTHQAITMCHQPSRHTSSRIPPPHLLNVPAVLHMNKNVPFKRQKMKKHGVSPVCYFLCRCILQASVHLPLSLSLPHLIKHFFSTFSTCVCVSLSILSVSSFFFSLYIHNVVICPVRTGLSVPFLPPTFCDTVVPPLHHFHHHHHHSRRRRHH